MNREKQVFLCRGCGKGGDVFTWIGMTEGVDFKAAVRLLAQKLGIDVRETYLDEVARQKIRLTSAEMRAFDCWLWLKKRRLLALWDRLDDNRRACLALAGGLWNASVLAPAEVKRIHGSLNHSNEGQAVADQELDRIDRNPVSFLQAFLEDFYSGSATAKALK